MKGWMLGMGVALALLGGPAFAHKEKRTDPCGCHHQWGLRHCHPKEKTSKCEAPAAQEKKSEVPERSPAPRKNVQTVDL